LKGYIFGLEIVIELWYKLIFYSTF